MANDSQSHDGGNLSTSKGRGRKSRLDLTRSNVVLILWPQTARVTLLISSMAKLRDHRICVFAVLPFRRGDLCLTASFKTKKRRLNLSA